MPFVHCGSIAIVYSLIETEKEYLCAGYFWKVANKCNIATVRELTCLFKTPQSQGNAQDKPHLTGHSHWAGDRQSDQVRPASVFWQEACPPTQKKSYPGHPAKPHVTATNYQAKKSTEWIEEPLHLRADKSAGHAIHLALPDSINMFQLAFSFPASQLPS